MRTILTRRPLAALAVLVAAVACADSTAPSAPAAPEPSALALGRAAVNGAPTYVASGKVLRRTVWENRDVVASAYVTPERGGRLTIKSAGLTVRFPAGAVREPMQVSVTALAGNRVVYEFGPHGTRFLAPILIEQDLKNTRAFDDGTLAGDLFGGYMPAGLSDVSLDGTVNVSETFAVSLTPDHERASRWARFQTTHFSGYALASGKTDSTTTTLKSR